jgi:hypothetical protein
MSTISVPTHTTLRNKFPEPKRNQTTNLDLSDRPNPGYSSTPSQNHGHPYLRPKPSRSADPSDFEPLLLVLLAITSAIPLAWLALSTMRFFAALDGIGLRLTSALQ